MAKADADDEEILGIVVGRGGVTGKAQVSESPMVDGEEDAAEKDIMQNLDIVTLSNGTNSKASNNGDFHKKLNAVKDHVEREHLFNLVAKGFN